MADPTQQTQNPLRLPVPPQFRPQDATQPDVSNFDQNPTSALTLPGGATTPPESIGVPGGTLPFQKLPDPPDTPPVDTPLGPVPSPSPQALQASGGLGGYLKGLAGRLPKALAIASAGYGNPEPLRAIEQEESRQQQAIQQQFQDSITLKREQRAQQMFGPQLEAFQADLKYKQYQTQKMQQDMVQAEQERHLQWIASKIPQEAIRPDGTLDLSRISPDVAQNLMQIQKTGGVQRFGVAQPGETVYSETTGQTGATVPGQPTKGTDFQRYFQQGVADGRWPNDSTGMDQAEKTFTVEKQPPQRPPQAIMLVPGEGGYDTAINVRPGSQVPNTAQTVAGAAKDAHTYYQYQGPDGKTKWGLGNEVPPSAQAIPIGSPKDFAAQVAQGNQSNIIQQGFNTLQKDLDRDGDRIWNNAAARNILTTTLEQIDRTSAGLLIAGTGGSVPLPSGMGDMINNALANKALDPATSRALKNYITDYRGVKDLAVAQQMQVQGGKIGKGNAEVIKAIMDQLPNGKYPDATSARRALANLQSRQDMIRENYPDQYGTFKKEPKYESKYIGNNPGGAEPSSTPAQTPRAPGSRQLSRSRFLKAYPNDPNAERALEQYALQQKMQIID